MKPKNLGAKKETEELLHEWKFEVDIERAERDLRRWKEELQQKDEQRQLNWDLKNERKKAAADKKQCCLVFELKK